MATSTIQTPMLAIEAAMIRLLIVEDQLAVLKALRMRLAVESDLSVIGEASDCKTAYDLAVSLCPDVVLVDVEMVQMDGMAVASALHLACPHAAIIMLSIHDDARIRASAAAAGAAAFVPKSLPPDTLLTAIRQVA
jgi:DNA-binding NarL/FixJ family response regulator